MMAKMKAAKAQAEEKVADHKAAQLKKDQAKWRAEVLDADEKLFKTYEGWADVYEPKKEAKEKEDTGPNAVERAATAKIAKNMQKDVVKVLMETVAKLLGPTSEALAEAEPEISSVINASNGAVLSYAFAHKGEKRMAYFRSLAADRLAVALGAALAKEATNQKIEAAGNFSPEQVKALVDAIVGKAVVEIEKKQGEAVEALKNSPLFAASGQDAAQVDAGVVALQEFLRGYVESKIGLIVEILQKVLGQLLELASKHKDAIAKHAAATNGGAGFEEGSAEFQAASKDVQDEIEKAFAQLNDAVGAYVKDLVTLVTGVDLSEKPKE